MGQAWCRLGAGLVSAPREGRIGVRRAGRGRDVGDAYAGVDLVVCLGHLTIRQR